MRSIALALFICLNLGQFLDAALVLRFERNSTNPIEIGQSTTISLFMCSDSGAIANLAGIDFALNVADPGLTGTRLVGGRFTQGTSNFFPVAAGAFQIPFPSSLALFGANNGTGLSLGTTDTLLATLTLGTTGIPGANSATPGTYNLGLTNVVAVDPGFNTIQTIISTPNLSFQIVGAVPEPSSLCLLALTACGLAVARKFSREKQANALQSNVSKLPK